MVREMQRHSQFSQPPAPKAGGLRDRLIPPSQFLGHRYVDDSQPEEGDAMIWRTPDFDGKFIWTPTRQGRLSFPNFSDGAADFIEYWMDSGEIAAGFGIGNSDTIANPYAAPGTYTASLYYANIGCYDFDTGNLIGRIEGWFAPVPANGGAADTAAAGNGPKWYINSDSGFTYAAHPSLDTRFVGNVVIYFNLGDGDGVPLRLEADAGTPTHSATEGTLYCDRTNNLLYMNTNGSTTWAALANASQLHTRLHTMTSTSDHSSGTDVVFYGDSSGNIQELDLGADGTVLTSNGATSAPSFETAGGGMKRTPVLSVLPSAIGAGTTLTKSASANTLGTFATIGTPAADSYIMGVTLEDFSAANNYGYFVIDTAPKFQAVGSLAATASGTLTVTGPTCADNDILIAAIYEKDETSSITLPNGWTAEVNQTVGGGADSRVVVAWKRAVAADDSGTAFQFTGMTGPSPAAGIISAWRGCVASGSPFSGTTTVSDNTGTADTVTYATYTPGRAGVRIVAIGFYDNDLTTAGAISGTDPTFVNRWDTETATGNDASIFGYEGLSIFGAATGARSHATTSTADASSVGVMLGLIGVGGVVIFKTSSSSTAPTADYRFIPSVLHEVEGGNNIDAAWAGNNAAGDTCVISLEMCTKSQLTDL